MYRIVEGSSFVVAALGFHKFRGALGFRDKGSLQPLLGLREKGSWDR